MDFKSLDGEHIEDLVRKFSEDEVHRAVCDSIKTLGPDGVNFGLVKEFWEDIKLEFTRVMGEFHSNCRMVKGANSSFIVLIPKKKIW